VHTFEQQTSCSEKIHPSIHPSIHPEVPHFRIIPDDATSMEASLVVLLHGGRLYFHQHLPSDYYHHRPPPPPPPPPIIIIIIIIIRKPFPLSTKTKEHP